MPAGGNQWAGSRSGQPGGGSPPPSYDDVGDEPGDLGNSYPPRTSPTSDKKPLSKNKAGKREDTPEEAAKKAKVKGILKWIRFGVYMVILVAVVGLCMISAFLSIKKLMETKDLPASTYTQKNYAGPHDSPGLIFIAEGVEIRSCNVFNLTSLNIDELAKDDICFDKLTSFQLHHSDPLSTAVNSSLPEFLQNIRTSSSTLSVNLIQGPSDWSNKQTVIIHMTIPDYQSGVWGVIYPDYATIHDQFQSAVIAGTDPSQRWELVQRLLEKNSMNFVSSNFRSFFLMSKQEFKKLGVLEAVRIDMEISLMESNNSHLDWVAGQEVGDPVYLSHVEAMYQWKDGYYMLGDSFMATTPWQIVTVISSALLMLERGYNTFMRAWASAKPKPKPPTDPNQSADDKEKEAAGENNNDDPGNDDMEDLNE